MTTTMSRPSLDLGVRYYDNSARSGSALGGDGLMTSYGFRERARNHRQAMIGDRAEYSGLRFATRRKQDPTGRTRTQTMSRLRKKQSRFQFWRSMFLTLDLWSAFNRIIVRINPFTSYQVSKRWSVR